MKVEGKRTGLQITRNPVMGGVFKNDVGVRHQRLTLVSPHTCSQ